MTGDAPREYDPPHPIPMGSARWDEAFRMLVDMHRYADSQPDNDSSPRAWGRYYGALRLFTLISGEDTIYDVDRQVKQSAKARHEQPAP